MKKHVDIRQEARESKEQLQMILQDVFAVVSALDESADYVADLAKAISDVMTDVASTGAWQASRVETNDARLKGVFENAANIQDVSVRVAVLDGLNKARQQNRTMAAYFALV